MQLIFLVNIHGSVPSKDKKGVTIVNTLQKILDSSKRKQNMG